MARELPADVLPEILLKLPVKSLLKFRCVCKSWNTLITSSTFAITHMNHNHAKQGLVLVRCYYEHTRDDAYALHSDGENLDKVMDIEVPFVNPYEFFYILDSAEGLFCLMDSYQRTNTVVLWNPSIRKHLTLPKPSYELSIEELIRTALGFGFDALGNDYKYVRIYDRNGKMTMDMFKLSTRSWTDVASASSLPSVRGDIGCSLNGALHWLAYNHSVVVFDLGSETFGAFSLPSKLKCGDVASYDVVVWRGLLGVYESNIQGSESACLWIMQEYGVQESWTKKLVIVQTGWLASIRTNGDMVLISRHDRDVTDVAAYDPETGRTKHDIIQLEGPLLRLQMMSYNESLALLNDGEDSTAHRAIEE